MKKIAIASEMKKVSGHFGHCEGFMTYDIKNGVIEKEVFVENPGHRPGFLPVFLKEMNVDLIISGGMGETAQELFVQNGIEVIVGANGEVSEVLDMYLKGELVSTGSVCKDHQHEDECHN